MNSGKAAEGSASLALAWSRDIKPLKAGSLGKVRHKARASGAPKLTLWSPQTPAALVPCNRRSGPSDQL